MCYIMRGHSRFYGRWVFGIFAALAEFERDLIVERAQAALRRLVCEVVSVG